jgi:tellurite resistance protein
VRQRLALVRACQGIHLGSTETARTILDGAWLIATADGALGHMEALALAKLIDTLTLPERIQVHEASFSDDEEEWYERLPQLDPSAHGVLIEVLGLVAIADGEFTVPERRYLHRLAKALQRDVDLTAIEAKLTRMREAVTPQTAGMKLAPA